MSVNQSPEVAHSSLARFACPCDIEDSDDCISCKHFPEWYKYAQLRIDWETMRRRASVHTQPTKPKP